MTNMIDTKKVIKRMKQLGSTVIRGSEEAVYRTSSRIAKAPLLSFDETEQIPVDTLRVGTGLRQTVTFAGNEDNVEAQLFLRTKEAQEILLNDVKETLRLAVKK